MLVFTTHCFSWLSVLKIVFKTTNKNGVLGVSKLNIALTLICEKLIWRFVYLKFNMYQFLKLFLVSEQSYTFLSFKFKYRFKLIVTF